MNVIMTFFEGSLNVEKSGLETYLWSAEYESNYPGTVDHNP